MTTTFKRLRPDARQQCCSPMVPVFATTGFLMAIFLISFWSDFNLHKKELDNYKYNLSKFVEDLKEIRRNVDFSVLEKEVVMQRDDVDDDADVKIQIAKNVECRNYAKNKTLFDDGIITKNVYKLLFDYTSCNCSSNVIC